MFDIGFSEIVVCAVVALIVIGPERMPEAVRTVGLWIGRLKRSLRETRSEIERQIGVDDIRRQLHNEDIMRTLEDARRDMDNVIAQTQESLNSITHYQSEPDLPYHAHMEENALAAQATELPALEANTPLISAPEKSSAAVDKKVLVDTKAPVNLNASPETKAVLDSTPSPDKKASL